jgi:predicted nuclease of predicted toxin-antitoxin system
MLSAKGHDAIHVGAIGMATATDVAILQHARQTGSVIFTLDADFHTLLAMSGAGSPSVVRIRIEGLKAPALVPIIAQVLARFGPQLLAGAVVSVARRRMSSRSLPLT